MNSDQPVQAVPEGGPANHAGPSEHARHLLFDLEPALIFAGMALINLFLAVALSLALAAPVAAAASEGAGIYAANCAACHGARGDGKGTLAEYCYPRPRDFTTGVYKFRSTPSGSIPTRDDLLRTVAMGIPGTAMPSWSKQLTPAQRDAVVEFLMGLSPRFARERPTAVSIGAPVPSSVAAVESGKGVYERMGCAACHGPGGRGDGSASASLKDEAGLPIRPFDFTRAGRMRGGDLPQDIYRTFTTGIDGTPMPAFAENLSESERWQLVHYIRSLGKDRPADPDVGPIRAVKVTGPAPLDPSSTVWEKAPASVIELHPLWSRDDTVDRAAARAIVSDGMLAVRLEWRDTKADRTLRAPESFRDGAAVQFPADPGGPLPFFGMGHAGAPIELWHWRADREAEMAWASFDSTPQPACSAYVDTYHGLEQDRTFLTASAAGNPLALRTSRTPADLLAAAGPGSLTARKTLAQEVSARGHYQDGAWRVVLARRLAGAAGTALSFTAKALQSQPIAFAVWDGATRDRNGKKSVSNWERIELVEK